MELAGSNYQDLKENKVTVTVTTVTTDVETEEHARQDATDSTSSIVGVTLLRNSTLTRNKGCDPTLSHYANIHLQLSRVYFKRTISSTGVN